MALRADSRPTYTICQGCPASGKSTWANSQRTTTLAGMKDKPVIVNRDATRRKLFDFGQWSEYRFTKAKEKAVTEYLDKEILLASERKWNVIDDNTNLNPKYLEKTANYARNLGFNVVFKQFFDVPLHKLIERNINREYSVPESVIHDMFAAQMKIQERVITPTEGLPECVIVDVDGTIADMGKGEKWGRMPYDWDKVGNDRPKDNVIWIVRQSVVGHMMTISDEKAGNENGLTGGMKFPKVIFLTGRDGVALEATKEWILKNVTGPCFGDVFESGVCEIFIRTPDDMRPDCDIKEELLRNEILPRFNVKFCIDDRNQMVDHYRALGLECWQVAAGRF